MTKAQLLLDLKANPICNAIIGQPKLLEIKKDDSRWYSQTIRNVSGKVAKYFGIAFYVVEEGLPTEAAYYDGNEPSSQSLPIRSSIVNYLAMILKSSNKGVNIYNKFSVSLDVRIKIIHSLLENNNGNGLNVSDVKVIDLVSQLKTDGIINDVDKNFILSFAK